MSEHLDHLISRLDAEFADVQTRIQAFQSQQLQEYEERQQRLEQLEQVFVQLRDVWRPRLEVLKAKFGDKVEVTPTLLPSSKVARFSFQSSLAHVDLRFSAMTDPDVRKVILCYDLEILPILMHFESHAETEFPLDQVDPQSLGQWIDDRIIDFVKTYLALHENELYLKGKMVEDPVAHIRFPKYAAATTLADHGRTLYFISDKTRQEYEQKQALTPS